MQHLHEAGVVLAGLRHVQGVVLLVVVHHDPPHSQADLARPVRHPLPEVSEPPQHLRRAEALEPFSAAAAGSPGCLCLWSLTARLRWISSATIPEQIRMTDACPICSLPCHGRPEADRRQQGPLVVVPPNTTALVYL